MPKAAQLGALIGTQGGVAGATGLCLCWFGCEAAGAVAEHVLVCLSFSLVLMADIVGGKIQIKEESEPF